ncbi:MAG TPA: hypothetical protein VNC41_05020 [Acidimicrobiia bacterium]|nr:hypothetical protein [Acidimicrobiia bacterium]
MKLTFVAAGALAVLALAGCGSSSKSDSSSSNPTTTAAASDSKSEVCTARSNLSDAVSALVNPSTLTGGKSSIESAFDDVKTDLDAFSEAAKDTYKPEVDDLKSSLDDLQTAVGKLGDGGIGEGLTAVGDAISDVSTSATALVDKVKADCP